MDSAQTRKKACQICQKEVQLGKYVCYKCDLKLQIEVKTFVKRLSSYEYRRMMHRERRYVQWHRSVAWQKIRNKDVYPTPPVYPGYQS